MDHPPDITDEVVSRISREERGKDVLQVMTPESESWSGDFHACTSVKAELTRACIVVIWIAFGMT